MNVKYRLSALGLVLAALLVCAPAAFAEDAAAETAPYTIDYEAETLQFDSTKYTLTDADGKGIEYKDDEALTDGVALGNYIVTAGGDKEAKSLILAGKDAATEDVTVPIPARPAAPALVPKWEAGTTIGIYNKNFCYWYTIDASDKGTDITTFASIQPIQCLEKPIPLTASATSSTLHVQSIAVKAGNEAGATPRLCLRHCDAERAGFAGGAD